MNMFGLEGSGFIVAIGVTLLISGAIVYYCNSRISSLEKAVVQQNQVLGDFITNVRASITMGGGSNQPPVASNDHANELAVDAANAFYSGTTPENRIEVSDDDEDEDEDEDDDDELSGSESESELESEDEDEDDGIIKVGGVEVNIIAAEILPSSREVSDNSVTTEPRVVEITGPDLVHDDDTKKISLEDITSLEHLDQATGGSLSDGESLSSSSSDGDVSTVLSAKLAVTDLKKIKVAQLKEMAQASGKTPADLKKMKKKDLIDFLEAKRAENK
jgi:hypothetical protein